MIEFIKFLNDNGLLNVAWVVLTVFGSLVLNILRKTIKNKYVLNLLKQGANWAVAVNAQNVSLSSSERFEKGKQYLISIADKHGMNFLDSTIEGLLELAYQQYKVNGGDNHFQPKQDDKPVNINNDNQSNSQYKQHAPFDPSANK
ncbi:hypothetical protein DY138_00805 [Apilactobacillus timberlakei]|uniref:phage holin, LLH family n=1 Tax=Apilactobacillus timberlakei TaxID=2008380 RepID=UPI00112A7361|nr:phage holin, LLH family [Apilactobacillus timberlakei]TPR20008.1 hypothetical protein DY138_00805 [Apilactobacillus timberlakei]TPR21726.1 hypothetical protein DY061_00720 [Apilactobacillus timberlakei]TPR22972.1 hypothetical protein DY083_02540 [Apilactobacillus timberlakei]